MRNTVTFKFPAPIVAAPDYEGILGVEGATWFFDLLRSIPGLDVEAELVQEDWGVVVFAQRGGRSFWIGLSAMEEHEWVAHVHHGSFAWLQRFSSAGKAGLREVASELDRALRGAGASSIQWFREDDTSLRVPSASPQDA
jgi:hypothetical protein